MAPPNDDTPTSSAMTVRPSSDDDASKTAAAADPSAAIVVPPTDMLYYTYEGNFQLECNAEILACQFISPDNEDNKKQAVHVSMNRTCMHARGGGQPQDVGVIEALDDPKTKILVENVLLDRDTGVATHMGTLVMDNNNDDGDDDDDNQRPSLVGQTVQVMVNAENRKILSECHTAGHVVDMAMAQCDTLLPPTKGYHFLDGPYVEYKGNIPADQRGPLLEKLQTAFQDLVQADIETEIINVPRVEAEVICNRVAENYFNLSDQFKDETETVRIVRVAGWPCPCGGTHVKSTGRLKERNWGITGIKCKKGVVRIKYGQDWNGSSGSK